MALATLFDDFMPVVSAPRRRRNRPVMLNLLDMLEDEMDQKVGQVVRRLPAALLDLGDNLEDNGRKRKRKTDAVCPYEPKSKVQILSKDDKFQVKLDTSNYQPDEITVKVINDRIAISAKHESRGDDVYEYHEMTRSFDLPEGVDPATVVSRLNTSGQLTIEAPMKPQKEVTQERVIPVEMSNDSPKKDTSENKKDSQTEKNVNK
ncbi:hypothetical protein TNIN_63091 [Trichonephila inaurata madagascariensis]|uniref:SHSP domain-containing protein n=1 Tax=Trichonephila inaurata madagascariensis TaxID=2747483 RepID=A0A8X6YA86_9ARAC|nr:hypothetical protein TNIN_63091 [Trichonephila inaurata madagascariensis]